MRIWLGLWLALNVFEIVLCGADKFYAKTDRWRIPEKALLGFGLVGGSLGLLLGMVLFHHKISKPVFRYGAPVMLLVQLGALLACLFRFWL